MGAIIGASQRKVNVREAGLAPILEWKQPGQNGTYSLEQCRPFAANQIITASWLCHASALGANPKFYDLESLMIHEFGHLLGFSHSAVWSATMCPFAAALGTFSGQRPTAQAPTRL
jgi:Matrixin